MASGAGRLGSDDWVRAALDLMVDEGIEGVKIHRLCERLGVTKGSFYWHFTDLDAFLGVLARDWADECVRRNGALKPAGSADPAQDLLQAMKLFSDRRNRNLTRAMRDWSHRDERAREAIHRVDDAVLERVTAVLLAIGFEPADAALRAKLLYYAGVGFAHAGLVGPRNGSGGGAGGAGGGNAELAAAWELLTRLPP